MKKNFYIIGISLMFVACAQQENSTPAEESASVEEAPPIEEIVLANAIEELFPSSSDLLETSVNASNAPIVYPGGNAKIATKVIVWEPGHESVVHKHPVPIVVTILQGELTIEFEEGGTMTAKAGESYVSTPDVWHKSSNQGDENLIIIGVFLGNDSLENIIKREEAN